MSRKLFVSLKSSLVVILATVLTFSTTTVFANESKETVEEYDVVQLEDNLKNDNVHVQTEVDKVIDSVEAEEGTTEVPTLLPGDFFYFAKIAIEKIKLAFTFDDVKQAELLATYTTARLAEIEVLLSEGKETMALETMEKALQYIEQISEHVEGEAEDNNDSVVEEETGVNGEGATMEEDATNDEGLVEETENPPTEPTEDEQVIVDEGDEDQVDEDNGSADTIGQHVARNIIALQAAMERVKNPVAKAALQKNIDKSYAKLAKKMAKFEKWCAHFEEDFEDEAIKGIIENGEDGVNESETLTTPQSEMDAVETTTKDGLPVVPAPTETNQQIKLQKKQAKQAEKLVEKQVKAAQKETKRELKREEKQRKNEMKRVEKQQRQQMKVERLELKNNAKQKQQELKDKHKNKPNNNGNGNNGTGNKNGRNN